MPMNPFVSDWLAAAFNAVLCSTVLPSTCVNGDEVVTLHMNGVQTTFHVARRYLERPNLYRRDDHSDTLLLLVTMPGIEGRRTTTREQFRDPRQYGTVLVVSNPNVDLETQFHQRTFPDWRNLPQEITDEAQGLRHIRPVPSNPSNKAFVPDDIYLHGSGKMDSFMICSDKLKITVNDCKIYYNNHDVVVSVSFPRIYLNQWQGIQNRINDVLKAS